MIFGEDTVVAARLLLAGYKVAYVAEACVYHSHSYTVKQQFKRYFDIGVLHSRSMASRGVLGQVNGEGKRFLLSELQYLAQRNPLQIPAALVHTLTKFAGYRLGRSEARLTPGMKRQLSLQPGFWEHPNSSCPSLGVF